ncbi:MAG: AAC(3) family N-acetyltransferase [candidate division Zixibacteria bacterium]|nr:AAC(3) family N-acetyltransferase [candidate division Zixibacteria bacterium]
MKPVTREDLLVQLRELGVRNDNLLLVHSNVAGAELAEIFACFEALRDVVQPRGTIAFPTFTFDFCKGKRYDCRRTPSQMGLLTEMARRHPDVRRIYHPIYGFALFGAEATSLADEIHNISSYGDDSLFGELRRRNGQILIINLPFAHSMTFFHHVEEMVGCDYRFMKSFTGEFVTVAGTAETRTYTMFVRDVDRGVVTTVEPMGRRLESLGLVREGQLGRWPVKLLEAGKVFEAMKQTPRDEPDLLRKMDPSMAGVFF